MSGQMKIRLIRGMMMIMAVWPLIQFGLTKTVGIDPWKFFGFGMYTVPRFTPTVHLYGVEGNIPHPLPVSRLTSEARAELERFLSQREVYGPRFRPDRAASHVQQAFPEFEVVQLVVSRLELDRVNGRLKRRAVTYEYRHAGP